MRFAGRAALVTGGASGIGEGVVRRLHGEGAIVTIADRDEAAALRLAKELGERAQGLMCDVTDADAVEHAVAAARPDILVTSAGVIDIAPVTETTDDAWRRTIDVNLTGTFLCCRAAARSMIARRASGAIVTVASGAGRRAVANLAGYCASKAGVLLLTQSLAIELAPHRIRVNAVAPGHIQTPFWGGIADGFAKVTGRTPEAVVEGFRQGVPWGKFGTPEDVAAAVAFLCSDDADYVSGHSLAMNGAELPG